MRFALQFRWRSFDSCAQSKRKLKVPSRYHVQVDLIAGCFYLTVQHSLGREAAVFSRTDLA